MSELSGLKCQRIRQFGIFKNLKSNLSFPRLFNCLTNSCKNLIRIRTRLQINLLSQTARKNYRNINRQLKSGYYPSHRSPRPPILHDPPSSRPPFTRQIVTKNQTLFGKQKRCYFVIKSLSCNVYLVCYRVMFSL